MDLVISGNYLHLFAFNQCFAKADISGDVRFLFRKLHQVSVNAKVLVVRSESKIVVVDSHARGKICSVVRKDGKCGTESKACLVKRSGVLKKKTVVQYHKLQK